MADLFELAGIDAPERVKKQKKKRIRNDKVDFIYTDSMSEVLGDMAVKAGLKWGIQSSNKAYYGINPITFIDNNYKNYNHQLHLDCVKKYHPKYATVMDIMTKEQCQKDSIKHYEFEQIMRWANELKEHAENVIVIPKYDCLDLIPDEFILGYSVPTSHGGTPLPLSRFSGRKVHILGGSWKDQLNCIYELGDSVVSLDNNLISKIAIYGSYVMPNGEVEKLSGNLRLTNSWHVALVMSFGAIAYKLNELYGDKD